MPYYDVMVDETRHYVVRYRIEADDAEQAVRMAEEGQNTSETELSFMGVLNRGVDGNPTLIPAFIEVEYDLHYRGGDYHDVGESAFLPVDGLDDDNIKQRFQEQTGHDPIHIVYYSFDDVYDGDGNPIEGGDGVF